MYGIYVIACQWCIIAVFSINHVCITLIWSSCTKKYDLKLTQKILNFLEKSSVSSPPSPPSPWRHTCWAALRCRVAAMVSGCLSPSLREFVGFVLHLFSSWWLQPIWKMLVKWDHFPRWKLKNIWNDLKHLKRPIYFPKCNKNLPMQQKPPNKKIRSKDFRNTAPLVSPPHSHGISTGSGVRPALLGKFALPDSWVHLLNLPRIGEIPTERHGDSTMFLMFSSKKCRDQMNHPLQLYIY